MGGGAQAKGALKGGAERFIRRAQAYMHLHVGTNRASRALFSAGVRVAHKRQATHK